MTPLAIATMAVVCGTVWGGLLVLIVHAVRSESRKLREAPRGETEA